MVKLTRVWFFLFALLSIFLPRPTVAQITPAGGTGTTVTVNGQQFDIGGGAFSRDGQNLFHLFQQFGLNEGQIANFLSNPGVRNVLAGVNGGDVSYINGLIQLTGGTSNLYLLNPAGIVFGPNASLNVPAAFHASTAQRVHFDGGVFDINGVNDYTNLAGNPTAFEFLSTGIIINEGNLAVRAGQNLSLMGHQVINTGTLSAPGGTITIQAVPETGMVRISQEGMLLSLEFPADRIPEDGVIEAVDIPRLITGGEDRPRVNSVVENPDGSISLVHDPSKVNVPVEGVTTVASGTLDVSTPEGMGGQVNVLGQNVALINAQLLANGPEGGGTILVGGDYLGGTTDTGRLDSSLNAQNLFVDNNTVMSADAVTQGQGGTVINWADQGTQFDGSVSARGGLLGGDGGFVEISGRETLDIAPGWSSRVDVSAPTGQAGTLLFDPSDITILATGTGDAVTNPFNPVGASGSLLDADIATFLGTSNLEITTSGGTGGNGTIEIRANANITWSAATTLTLNADRNIIMNAGAVIRNTHTGSSFDAIVFNANTAGTATDNFIGIELNGATLSAQDGNIRLTGHGGNDGSGNHGILQLNNIQVSTTSGDITYNGTGGNGTDNNFGIYLYFGIYLLGSANTITSQSGNIELTGTGQGSGQGNYGISQFNGPQVSTTSGNITYIGIGGEGTNFNFGISLAEASTTITSQGGQITLTGTGRGTGIRNFGIYQQSGARVNTTSGDINYTGTGASGASAIQTQSFGGNPNSLIGNGTTGNITLTSTNNAITLNDLTLNTTGNLRITSPGNVTQNANTSLQATGLELLGAGNFTLNQANQIGTLAADVGGNLVFHNANNLQLGTVGSTTGLRAVSIQLTLPGNRTLSEAAAGTIQTPAGGNINLTAGTINLPNVDLITRRTAGGVIGGTPFGSAGDVTVEATNGNIALRNIDTSIATTGLVGGSSTVGSGGAVSLTGQDITLNTINSSLAIGGFVSESTVDSGGAVTLDANGNITLAGDINSSLEIGQSVINTSTIGSGGAVSLTGQDITLDTINSSLAIGQIGGLSISSNSTVGSGGAVSLSGQNLAFNGDMTATLTTAGTIQGGATVGTGGNLRFTATGTATQNSGVFKAPGLELLGAGNFTLNQANEIGTLAANTTGTIDFTTSQNLDLGTVNTTNGITAPTLILNITGGLSQSQPITVQNLGITATGDVLLNNPTNQIQTLGADLNFTGELSVVTTTDLTIDTVNPDGIENAVAVLLQAGGDIILEQEINAIDDITLVATNNFINNAGANALQPSSGRWLVYSTSPGANQPGGLTGSEQFGLTYPGVPSFGGDGFIFSGAAPIAPIEPPSTTQPLVVTTISATVTNPVVTPPPVPTSTPPTPPSLGSPPPTILTPVDLPLPSGLSTILQGQEEEEMPLDQSLCQLLEEGEGAALEIDGVPVESALAEECR